MWSKQLVEWTEKNIAYLSVVFSWHLQDAYQRAIWYKSQGYCVRAGGPAVMLNPEFLSDVAEIGGNIDALSHHNPDATFTSRGCVNKCPFCAVPIIEGDLVELDDWSIKPIVCDNNFLACSKRHFDDVIDKLKPLSGVDFNQGIDARLLTDHHAQRLAELDLEYIRLAWDDTRLENRFMVAFQKLRDAGFPLSAIQVYVLIGFNDTPDDALYRLETVRQLGARPYPMRYQPLNAKFRNEYVGPNWTDAELKRYTRYWSRLSWFNGIPFEEYRR